MAFGFNLQEQTHVKLRVSRVFEIVLEQETVLHGNISLIFYSGANLITDNTSDTRLIVFGGTNLGEEVCAEIVWEVRGVVGGFYVDHFYHSFLFLFFSSVII